MFFLGGGIKKTLQNYYTTMHVNSNLEKKKRNPKPNLILSNYENIVENIVSSITNILEIK